MAYYNQQASSYKQHQFAPRGSGYRANVQQNYFANKNAQAKPPQSQHPGQLKRQASELKSMYPLTKWSAVYLNTKANNKATDQWVDDNIDVTTPIPHVNIYIPMDLEENIIAEVQMYIDEEKELMANREKEKQEIIDAKNREKQKKEDAENTKVDTFMNFTSMTDKTKARSLLEKNDWDLQAATAQAFSSNSDLFQSEGPGAAANHNNNHNHNNNNNNNYQTSGKAVIRMILPDNRTYVFQMDGNDTFWGVYGRLLQSVPELTSKAFTLILENGHSLSENEFDQTLVHAHLVPRGDIRIKY